MSEIKHTSGPWWVSQIGDGAGNYGGIAIDTTSPHEPGTMEVCEVWGTVDETHVDDMAHANARLIAAAPELLEACRKAIYAINGREHDGFLRDAIEKATGERP